MSDPTLSDRIASELTEGTANFDRATALAGIPLPSPDVASLLRTVQVMKTILDTLTGTGGSVLDKAVTVRELIADGSANFSASGGLTIVGETATTTPAGDTTGTTPIGYVDPRPVLTTPPTPTNLAAQGAFKTIMLAWDLVNYRNHAGCQIWRNTTDNLATATLLDTVPSTVFADASGTLGSVYYYWVRAVNLEGVFGAYNATAGVEAGLLRIGNTDLGQLVVTADKLSQGTYDGVNMVPNPGAEDGTAAWFVSDGGVNCTFTADTTQKAGGAQSFRLQKGSTTDRIGVASSTIPVIPGETYSIRVRVKGSAASAGGFTLRVNEDVSNPAAGYVPPTPGAPVPPGSPALTNATGVTTTGLAYTLADPTSNGGAAITSRATWISFDGTNWTALPTPIVGSNSITFASSTSARTAQLRATVTNSAGPSGYGVLTGIAIPAAAAAPSTPTIGASTWISDGGTPATLTTAAVTTVGGASSVGYVLAYGAATATLSDSKGNTWVAQGSASRAGTQPFRLFRCVNFVGGANHTFTMTGGGQYPSVSFIEVRSAAAETFANFVVDTGTPFTHTITTAGTNRLVLTFCSSVIDNTPAGWTDQWVGANGAAGYCTHAYSKLVAAAGAVPISLDSTSSADAVVAMVSLVGAP